MGNDQTTLLPKDVNRLSVHKFVEISAQHNKKIYHKNLKPFKEFVSIIKSIHIRSTYLKYGWAQFLCIQLSKDPAKIYQQYSDMFKLSLMKKSTDQECFHLKGVFEKFLNSLQKKAKTLQTKKFSQFQLEKLFQEVKCYLMIENWFVELPLNYPLKKCQATLRSISKENSKPEKSTQFITLKSCNRSLVQPNNQKIYRTLLKLTEVYFKNHYHEQVLQDVTHECLSPKKNPINRFTQKQVNLIKKISKESSFKQRQLLIAQLLGSILKEDQIQHGKIQITNIQHKKLVALAKVLELKNVYCVLKMLTEVGSIDNIHKIQLVFNHVMKTMLQARYKTLQQNVYETKKQSPLRKGKLGEGQKGRSIR